MASYLDALDWLLICPPSQRELPYMLVDELRLALNEALSLLDAAQQKREGGQ